MRTITVRCDAPGCNNTTEQTGLANSFVGWLRRQVKDGVKRELAEGVRDFDAAIVQHFCPGHARSAELLPSPPTHPEVLEFLDQEQTGNPNRIG